MPKFGTLHPNATPALTEQYDCDGDTIILSDVQSDRCIVCGELTAWYSISFLARFCSSECLNSVWEEYAQAARLTPSDD